ncbi:MAG TPA: inner membrane-spanning protein YciB [Croceibacterium sp.]|nr:inner membrane-spanning protein YciB [Croceibacterium sp.]
MGEAKKKNAAAGWINLLVDYGPLIVFFIVYRRYAPDGEDMAGELLAVVKSTGAFIVAAIVALIVSKWRLGKVSPMLWLSTALIVGFGALTIYFHDQFYVQIKPTVIYLVFGISLLVGWWMGKALLKWLLEAAFEGLSEEGWLKLSRNWGFFFLVLAALNEALRLYLSFGDWLAAKIWVFLPLSFLFTFAQLPMLLRHGLAAEDKAEVIEHPPSE